MLCYSAQGSTRSPQQPHRVRESEFDRRIVFLVRATFRIPSFPQASLRDTATCFYTQPAIRHEAHDSLLNLRQWLSKVCAPELLKSCCFN